MTSREVLKTLRIILLHCYLMNNKMKKTYNKRIVQLIEQHIIMSNEWKYWCVKVKEIYNQTFYYWMQSMFKNIEYFTKYEILEPILKHDKYVVSITKCGLFRAVNGLKFNANQNGVTNILKKVIGDNFLVRFNKSTVKAPTKMQFFEQKLAH